METAAGQAAIPYFYFTTANIGSQLKIADYLGHSEENALTITDLERLTGRRSREIRKDIEAERRAGILIVSDNKSGYWLTDDPAEVARFTRSMRHRAGEIMRTAQAIERGAGLD